MVEDDTGLCGYALAVLDAKNYYRKLEAAWIPELLQKYPIDSQLDKQCIKHKYLCEFIEEMHNDYKQVYTDPDAVLKNYPSLLNLTVMSSIIDFSVPKRMLACVIAALKANGEYCD